MCNDTTLEVIEEIIKGKVNNQETFTAYDVSLAVQNTGIRERHLNMKNHIHAFMEDYVNYGDYRVTTVPVPNGTPPYAILYFHMNSDPNNYNLHNPVQNQLQQLNPTASPSNVIQQVNQQSNQGGYSLDSRDRLFIPTKNLRDIGLNPGDKAKLVCGKGELEIHSDNNPFVIGTLIVEKNGEIRIAKKYIIHSEIEADSYNIVVENGVIKVKPVL